MTLPPEYVELLTAVVGCLAGDQQTPLRTADEIVAWMHAISADRIENALNHGSEDLLRRMVQRLIEETHDPRLSDWTPEQIASWCQRTEHEHLELVLADRAKGTSV